MRWDAFIGGSYESQAYTADQERLVNWFVETLQSPGASAPRALYPTPGAERILTVDVASPGRAHRVFNGREFAVIGGRFCEFDPTTLLYAAQTTGGNDMLIDGNPATIDSNGDGGGQLFITSAGRAYVWDLAAATLTGVSPIVGQAHFGGFLDGYFVALNANASRFHVSELLDGLTWNTGTMFAQRSLAGDPWRSMIVEGRAIWLFGEHTSEIWYNTGDTFPFAPIPNGLLQYGIAAPRSAVAVGADVIWLAADRSGKACVIRASGLTLNRISTYPLETAMEGYADRTGAVAYSYTEDGHTFYVLNFDRDNATWVWDAETKLWHERGTWIEEEGRFVALRMRHHAFAFGAHRMLDRENGSLYRIGGDLPRDVDGRLIRRVRRAPAIVNELQRVFYPELELDLEPGIGIDGCQVSFTMEPLALGGDFEIVTLTNGDCCDDCLEDVDCISAVPDITGGSGDYTYHWTAWSEQDGTEETPAYDDSVLIPYYINPPTGLCNGSMKLVVTDNQTAETLTTTKPFTHECP